jgi:hypothetical protein
VDAGWVAIGDGYSYACCIPERRSGVERRSGKDRRQQSRMTAMMVVPMRPPPRAEPTSVRAKMGWRAMRIKVCGNHGNRIPTATQRVAAVERGVIRKPVAGRIRVALVYPNLYHVGMSNLGFQTVYRLINDIDHVVCERAFLPEQDGGKKRRVLTVESQTPIEDFDIIAFSISYENDAPGVLTILETAGLPLPAAQRGATLPLVLAGGVFCFLNPEPLAPLSMPSCWGRPRP